MKISISYPPLESPKGKPTLQQNRQFQWFNKPTYIYPVIPASAATLLSKKSYDVFWDDGIAEELTYEEWLKRIISQKPDVIAIETKTPVIKKHWQIIREIKEKLPGVKCVLYGDHVTALPEESFNKCPVDYVLTGGDYDLMLLNLANHLDKGEVLAKGWVYRDSGYIKDTGKYELLGNLDDLPQIDRSLTQWKQYAYKNGNFKYTPGTYIMASRDCWYGKCSFCSWVTLYPGNCNRTRSAGKVLDEVGDLIDLGVKEIMEDSGTLPIGDWLQKFCKGMVERGYNKKIKLSCNMRFGAIANEETWKLMKKAGFRMILFGLESVNQETLKKLKKGVSINSVELDLKACKKAGLEPHVTIMVGYPWETKQDAEKTVNFAKRLFKKGLIDSLQATTLIPYPGTPLYDYCRENDLLLTNDYDCFDQSGQVMKCKITDKDIKKMTASIYWSSVNVKYLTNKILSIRSWRDIKWMWTATWEVIGKVKSSLFGS